MMIVSPVRVALGGLGTSMRGGGRVRGDEEVDVRENVAVKGEVALKVHRKFNCSTSSSGPISCKVLIEIRSEATLIRRNRFCQCNFLACLLMERFTSVRDCSVELER